MLAGAIMQGAASIQEAITGSLAAGYNIYDAERKFNLQKNAHQNEVRDLKAAGLNPILSAGGGGTQVGAPVQLENPLRGSAANVRDIVSNAMQAKVNEAAINETNTRADVNKANKNYIMEQALTESSKRSMNNAIAQYQMENSKLPESQKNEILSRIRLNNSQGMLNSAMTQKWQNEASLTDMEFRQLELQMDKERAYSDFYKSWWGKKEPYINSVLGAASTAADVGTRGLGGKISSYMLRKLLRGRKN